MYYNSQNRLKRNLTTGLIIIPVLALIYLINEFWEQIKLFFLFF